MSATKIDDNTIQVTKDQLTPAPIVQNYDYDFLISQRAQIIKQANDYLSDRQKELDIVDNLISQADALGVKPRVMPSPIQPIGDVIK